MPTKQNDITLNNRHVTRGTELSVAGWRGRYRFQYAHTNDQGDLAEVVVYGGPKGHGIYRSCAPERVRTVHRIPKGR